MTTTNQNEDRTPEKAEELVSEVYFETLQKILDSLRSGKVSAQLITAVSRFLSDQGFNLASLKEAQRNALMGGLMGGSVKVYDNDEVHEEQHQPFDRTDYAWPEGEEFKELGRGAG